MSSSKPRTRKILASQLKAGMVIVIPAQRGVVKSSVLADKHTPSLSKNILFLEMAATSGPWKGTTGKALILESDQVEIEVSPPPLRRLVTWLVSFVW